MQVDFKFAIGQIVIININDLPGKVIGLYINRHAQKQAHVEYIDRNGAIFTRYFDETEVKS